MLIRTAEGYRDGKTYRLRFTALELLADKEFAGEGVIPKYKVFVEGEHGRMNRLYSINLTETEPGKLEPILRPNMGFARFIQALGASWDDVMAGKLAITILDAKQRKAYGDDWKHYPRLKDSGQQGFAPLWADITLNGESLLGKEVIVTAEVEGKSGIVSIGQIVAIPEG